MAEAKVISFFTMPIMRGFTHEDFEWAEEIVKEVIPDASFKSEFFDKGTGYGILITKGERNRAIALMSENEIRHDKDSFRRELISWEENHEG